MVAYHIRAPRKYMDVYPSERCKWFPTTDVWDISGYILVVILSPSYVYAKSQSCIHILCVYTYINKRNIRYMMVIDCDDDCFTLVI